MSRHMTNRLIGNYGQLRCIGRSKTDKFHAQRSNINFSIEWNQRASVSVICRDFCTRKSLSDISSSRNSLPIAPRIHALLSETSKINQVPKNIINNSKSLVRRQWDAFFNWYDEVSHTNEVRTAHKQVEELQEKLRQTQEMRRDVSKELNDIRYELQTCFADQANCQKGDPRYLELIRREIEVSNKVKQKSEEFNLIDKAERDLFILMQSAVRTSHEKEKVHTNSAKYWSIVGSLAGALLGICGTAFSFYNRNDLLADINKEFVVIRNDTESISIQVQRLVDELEEFLRSQQQRDRELLEREARTNVAALNKGQSNESWIHWIARKTYVIPVYRYFVPASVR